MKKAFIKIAIMLICAIVASVGFAFLLTPAQLSPPSPWVWFAEIGTLPEDGTPVHVKVAIPERDAWTRHLDRVLGRVFLRRVPGTDAVVALHSITRYGSSVEYDVEAGLFHDRRCWGFRFDMDGKCVDPHPHSDLLKLDVQICEGRVYIRLRDLR
jgi:hypothetical protein